MAKYHIALNGNHVICKANKKPCPRGEEYHFEADTKEEAIQKADELNEVRANALKNVTPVLDVIYNVGDFTNKDGTTLRDNLSTENKMVYDYYKETRELYKADENQFYNTVAHLTREGRIDKQSDFYREVSEDAKHYENFNMEQAVADNSKDLVQPTKLPENALVIKTDKKGRFRKNYVDKILSDPNTIIRVNAQYTDDYVRDVERNYNTGAVLSTGEMNRLKQGYHSNYSSLIQTGNKLTLYHFNDSYSVENENLIIDGTSIKTATINSRVQELRQLQDKGILGKDADPQTMAEKQYEKHFKFLLEKKRKLDS